jgi:ribosomal protein L25 (general stress protein Ctc)
MKKFPQVQKSAQLHFYHAQVGPENIVHKLKIYSAQTRSVGGRKKKIFLKDFKMHKPKNVMHKDFARLTPRNRPRR